MPTVLVLEDEDAIRSIVMDVLSACDLAGVGVAHPDELAPDAGPFDLVLADLVEQSGRPFDAGEVRGFVERLRQRFGAPVVLFTAYGAGTVGAPGELGAAGVIGKPFDLDQLANDLLRYLGLPLNGGP